MKSLSKCFLNITHLYKFYFYSKYNSIVWCITNIFSHSVVYLFSFCMKFSKIIHHDGNLLIFFFYTHDFSVLKKTLLHLRTLLFFLLYFVKKFVLALPLRNVIHYKIVLVSGKAKKHFLRYESEGFPLFTKLFWKFLLKSIYLIYVSLILESTVLLLLARGTPSFSVLISAAWYIITLEFFILKLLLLSCAI